MGSGSNVDRMNSKFIQPGATPGLLAVLQKLFIKELDNDND